MVISKVVNISITIVQQLISCEHIDGEIAGFVTVDIHKGALINRLTIYIEWTLADELVAEWAVEIALVGTVYQAVVTNGIGEYTIVVVA